ncbi:MAG: thiamine pyrophosphate-dependent dehydrogenase E1 component subunit alpha [Nitrososphaeria archaeon]
MCAQQYQAEFLLKMYELMLKSRIFEEKIAELYRKGELVGLLHLYIGQEAVAVGVITALRNGDVVLSTHRGHGHAIAKGVPLKNLMAELYGKSTGTSKGLAGSMHLVDVEHGLPLSSSIVGGGIPICVGMAWAYKLSKSNNVATCFFGDGAVATGDFHESLNLAALLDVPAVFVCENNQYALSLPVSRGVSSPSIADLARAYGIKSFTANGMDVINVYEIANAAINNYARKEQKPVFIEAKTYRFLGHHLGDLTQPYRAKEEVDAMKKLDPISNLRDLLIREYGVTESALDDLRAKIVKEVEDAVEFARNSPYLDPRELPKYVYSKQGGGAQLA